MQNSRIKKLKIFNLAMGFLHLIQAILMVWLSTDFTISITSSYLMGPPGSERMGTEILTDLRLGIFVALFMLISSIAHFSVSTFGFNWYKKNLQNHINRARWIEYSLSSSLMIVIIAALVGITDVSFLVVLFVVNASMIFLAGLWKHTIS